MRVRLLLCFLLTITFLSAQNEQSIIVPLTRSNGINIVECEINGAPIDFVFDTGASNTTIGKNAFLNLLKLGFTFESVGQFNYSLADGSTGSAKVYVTPNFYIAGYELKEVRFAVLPDANAPNLLGQNVFKQFSSYRVKEKYVEFILKDQSSVDEKIIANERSAEGYTADMLQKSFFFNSILWTMNNPGFSFTVGEPNINRDMQTNKKFVEIVFVMKDGLNDFKSYDVNYQNFTDKAMNVFTHTRDICYMDIPDPDYTHQKFLVADISWVQCVFIYKFKDGDKKDNIIMLLDDKFMNQIRNGGLVCDINYFRPPY